MKLQMLEFFFETFSAFETITTIRKFQKPCFFFKNMKSMFVNEFLLNISLTNYIVRTRKMK